LWAVVCSVGDSPASHQGPEAHYSLDQYMRRQRTLLGVASRAVALITAPQVSIAQTSGDKPFCLRHESGSLQCNYDTMAQCQQGREGRSVGGGCVPNPGKGTTGERGMSPRPGEEPRR
jgi:hypothetical protein